MNMSFMKKFALMILLTAVPPPSQVLAEYKTLLKSGEEFYAVDYWVDSVDNDVIRLLANGAMTRIPRRDILYIAPVADDDQRFRTAIKRISFEGRPHPASAELEIASPAPTSNENAPSPFQQDAEQLWQELELAKEEYREVLKKGELEKHQEARNRIQDLSRQLHDLQERVKADNLGEIPEWWSW